MKFGGQIGSFFGGVDGGRGRVLWGLKSSGGVGFSPEKLAEMVVGLGLEQGFWRLVWVLMVDLYEPIR